MSNWIFSTVWKARVFVRVHMEHVGCLNPGMWGKRQISKNFPSFPVLKYFLQAAVGCYILLYVVECGAYMGNKTTWAT